LIPVWLVFVYPGGPADTGPTRRAGQRASDADRDITADILCAAVGDGRLTLDELDERLGVALSARTVTELAELIVDLTARPGPPPSGQSGNARTPPGAPSPSRWAIIQSQCTRARTGPGA